MVAFGFMELIMLVVMGGPIGNDLLSFVDSQAYWKAKGVDVSVPAMTEQVGGAKADAEDPKVRSIRRLMAIRTLGELKDAQALPTLKKLLKSKEPFVADYSARAVAAITGKTYAPPKAPAAARQRDLGLLPAGCGVVGQAMMIAPADKTGNLRSKLGDAKLPGGMGKDQALEMLTEMVLKLAEKVGNIRLEAVTIGAASEIGEDSGFAVVVARGLYDAATVRNVLAPMARESTQIDGIDVLRLDSEVALIAPSNDRLVIVTGPRKQALPVREVISSLKANKTGLQAVPELRDLVKSVPAGSPLWAVAVMSDSYRQASILAPFDTAQLVSVRKKGQMHLKLLATGADEPAVAGSVAEVKEGLAKATEELTRQIERQPSFKPILEFLKSVKAEAKGKQATVTATMKGGSPVQMLVPMLMGFSSTSTEVHVEEHVEDDGNF